LSSVDIFIFWDFLLVLISPIPNRDLPLYKPIFIVGVLAFILYSSFFDMASKIFMEKLVLANKGEIIMSFNWFDFENTSLENSIIFTLDILGIFIIRIIVLTGLIIL